MYIRDSRKKKHGRKKRMPERKRMPEKKTPERTAKRTPEKDS